MCKKKRWRQWLKYELKKIVISQSVTFILSYGLSFKSFGSRCVWILFWYYDSEIEHSGATQQQQPAVSLLVLPAPPTPARREGGGGVTPAGERQHNLQHMNISQPDLEVVNICINVTVPCVTYGPSGWSLDIMATFGCVGYHIRDNNRFSIG